MSEIWDPSDKLSEKVKGLRDEYFSFYDREYFRNEVMPFTTGTDWDELYSYHDWGVVPDLFTYLASIRDSLKSMAIPIDLPEKFWERSLVVRRAIFFERIIEEYLPVKILEGELIVGSHFNTALSKCFTREEAKKWWKEESQWFKEMLRLRDFGVMNCGSVPGHIIPSYKKVLEIGFKGIKEEIEGRIKGHTEKEKIECCRAMIISIEGTKRFTERYAEEAERLAKSEKNEKRRKELLDMARICRKVPWEPAETFYEALQSVWFTHMLVMAAESYPGPGLSHGRFDQYMYPYYKRDIEERKITKEFAKELLECFWIKHNYAYDYMGFVGVKQGINSGFGQLMTLGGITPDGKDAVNELTWLLLDVIDDMNMLEPKRNIRISDKTSDEFLMRVCESIRKTQGSAFLLNFDENVIRALLWEGLSNEDAIDYGVVGCLENTAQGKDRSGTVDANINLAKPIELVLSDGRDMLTKKRINSKTGNSEKFSSYEEFEKAYLEQLDQTIEKTLKIASKADEIRAKYEPTPYLSALVEGCAEKGKDVRNGGPVYNFITVEGVGLATAADSLSALKKLVYEDKKVSMREILDAVKNNFEGNEALRRMLSTKAPKYGNDDDYVDSIARKVSNHWTEEVFKYRSPHTGRRFRGGYLSWNYFIDFAPNTAATPDGRLRETFLSNGIQPVQGMDKKGPTAMIRSAGKLGLETAPNGASQVIGFNSTSLRDEEHLKKFASLLRAYGEVGGTSLQINIIDPETLKDAQKNPEEYQNLLVRVTGYNAYFAGLGKEIQDEIIARESHRV
ncbi:MAG TPA: formate C-acetyltransferase/glycerol dehydratase family glycyl radical enzyme [Thermoplasmata archaeon]|nr:formate C-acetyltransferase/glycerol dehydratase family glycyl radical enzyme [Thermoplasmata archaeon]